MALWLKRFELRGTDGEKQDGDVPLLRIDRSVKFAQQVLNRMVVFPASPPTAFPLEFFRLAVTVRVVTPTETQLPCRQHRSVFTGSLLFLFLPLVSNIQCCVEV